MQLAERVRRKIYETALSLGMEISLDQVTLEHPDVEDFGDFSTNISLKLKGGRVMAEKIAEKINEDELIKKAEVAGPGFLNIWLQTDALIREVNRVISLGSEYGRGDEGLGKTIVIDYSAPNIAKRFGIGHLRSTIIGQALYNLYNFLGYKTIGDNHLGDWGTQFGKLLYMIDKNGGDVPSVDTLEEWYVEFHKHSEWDEEGRVWFKKLEDGDEYARNLWKKCVEVSMEEFEKLYKLMGVNIDFAYGESFYEDKMASVIVDAKQKGLAKVSEGALIVEVEGMTTPLMLLKSNGGTTYATRDLATIKYRIDTWKPEIIIYEVGAEQTLHLEQVFYVARALGYVSKDIKLVHTKHGLYLSADGKKFKTRAGNTVNLQEVFDEAVERASKLAGGDSEISTKVGIGAIKYFDLSHNVSSDIVFDWEKVMALDGNSGPYLQYTNARINSLLFKAKNEMGISEIRLENGNFSPEEMKLLRYLYRFPEFVSESAKRFAPNLVCNYLFELSSRFNSFYNQHSVLNADNADLVRSRVAVAQATGVVIKNGLRILGIDAVEKM